MPKDLIHGIPIFALALVFLIVLIVQLLFSRKEPKTSADASADAFVMKYPLRYTVLYAVLIACSAAIPIVFAVLKLDSVLLYVIGGVMLVFSVGELYGSLRRRIAYAAGKFTLRPEFGGEEEFALADVAEVVYKKSFAGETIKAYGSEGKLFDADLSYRNFGLLKTALCDAGLIKEQEPVDPTDAEATGEDAPAAETEAAETATEPSETVKASDASQAVETVEL